MLGLLNLNLVLRTPADEMVHPTGLRSRLLSRLTHTSHPFAIAAIGALFAVSMDTLSQAVLFSATAARFGGWGKRRRPRCAFYSGMLLVDGVNGAWVAALLTRADRRARLASRAIGLFVALLSFAVAALGVVQYYNPSWDAILESSGLLIGVSLVIAVALGSILLGPLRPGEAACERRGACPAVPSHHTKFRLTGVDAGTLVAPERMIVPRATRTARPVQSDIR